MAEPLTAMQLAALLEADAVRLRGTTAIVGPGCNDLDAMAERLRQAACMLREADMDYISVEEEEQLAQRTMERYSRFGR